MGRIKVAIAGVGNCSSALLQSILYYKNAGEGLIHKEIGGYKAADIEIVGALDIDSRKVGKDISRAIFTDPNVAPQIVEVPDQGLDVAMGMVLDGADGVLKDLIQVSDSKPVDVASYLRQKKAEMLINLLPTGATKASAYYAKAALDAGCAFINCTPAKIVKDKVWGKSFASAGLPLVGDDLMSQLGGTALHMGLLDLFAKRGIAIDKTYQLDIGGSMEAYGVLEDYRREEKRKVKSDAIKQSLPEKSKVATGTSDYVAFMKDKRTSYFFIHGAGCLGSEVIVDIYFRTQDSSNGAGMLLEIIRGVRIALDRKLKGPVESISSYGFKSSPSRATLTGSQIAFEDFVAGKRND
jgi:myo-inositol-1-phosphate synthase